MFKHVMLTIIIAMGLSASLHASFDAKRAAEHALAIAQANTRPAAAAAAAQTQSIAHLQAPHRATVGAGNACDARPASAAASAQSQAVQQNKRRYSPFNSQDMALWRALKNNDGEFVQRYLQDFPDQRAYALQRAAHAERPDILLALVPQANPGESDENALKRYFFARADLTALDVRIYHHMLELLKQKDEDHFRHITQCLRQDTSLKAPDLASLVAQMLYPTLREKSDEIVAQVHPELEAAIMAGDLQKVTTMTQNGWLVKSADQGLAAFKMAVRAGCVKIVTFLLDQMPWIGDKAMDELRQIIGEKYRNDQQDEKYTKIDHILTNYIPPFAIGSAFQRCRPGQLLQVLEKGADQTQKENAVSLPPLYAVLLVHNPALLQILACDQHFNPDATIEFPANAKIPLLNMAIKHGSREQVRILLEAGSDPNKKDSSGISAIESASAHTDCIYLKLIVYSKKLDPNTCLICDDTTAPLLIYFICNEKPHHFKTLLDAGFDPNVFDGKGKTAAEYAINNDNPIYLKMLADTKKLNSSIQLPNGNITALVSLAIEKNRSSHIKVLLDAGFVPSVHDHLGSPLQVPAHKIVNEQSESRLAAAGLFAVAWAQEAAGQVRLAAAAAQASQDADAGTSVGGKRKAQSDGTSNKKPKNDQ